MSHLWRNAIVWSIGFILNFIKGISEMTTNQTGNTEGQLPTRGRIALLLNLMCRSRLGLMREWEGKSVDLLTVEWMRNELNGMNRMGSP